MNPLVAMQTRRLGVASTADGAVCAVQAKALAACEAEHYSIKSIDAMGYAGGFILGVCLLPQVYTTIKTRTTDTISLSWQLLYLIGLSLIQAYSLYNNLMPMYIPGFVELVCVIFLTFTKIRTDGFTFKVHSKEELDQQRLAGAKMECDTGNVLNPLLPP